MDARRPSEGIQRHRKEKLTIFGGIAMILSAIGIYGVMADLASRRIREIGLRMALGARPHDVLTLVLRRGVLITGIGVVVGIVGALAATRFVARFLYDVSPADPLTFAGMTVILWLVALAAMFISAYGATRVDPVVALRHE